MALDVAYILSDLSSGFYWMYFQHVLKVTVTSCYRDMCRVWITIFYVAKKIKIKHSIRRTQTQTLSPYPLIFFLTHTDILSKCFLEYLVNEYHGTTETNNCRLFNVPHSSRHGYQTRTSCVSVVRSPTVQARSLIEPKISLSIFKYKVYYRHHWLVPPISGPTPNLYKVSLTITRPANGPSEPFRGPTFRASHAV